MEIRTKLLTNSDSLSQNYYSLTVHDGGSYHEETSPLICYANYWIGFYIITTLAIKEVKVSLWGTDPIIKIFFNPLVSGVH